MRRSATAVIAALCLSSTIATTGVDYSTAQSVGTHQCWRDNGMEFAIPRAYYSNGQFDPKGKQNVDNARAAGIPYVDIYMFPCRGKSAQWQVDDLINNMGDSNYGMIWLDIENNPSDGCNWDDFSDASNCDYVSYLIDQVRARGRVPGVYSSYYMWERIMGSSQNCQGHSSAPLWYAHYDDNASFSDFRSFGGWSRPNMKQYVGDDTLCGAGVDYTYY